MKMTAIGHRILIKLDKVEKKTKGGIYLTDESADRQQLGMERGTVVSIGPTAYQDYVGDPWVEVGDRVLFTRYEGILIEDGDDKYRAVNDIDVYAKIDDSEA